MSEVDSPSSTADMAKQRREQRRRRILMTSEERMRKIMELSEENQDVMKQPKHVLSSSGPPMETEDDSSTTPDHQTDTSSSWEDRSTQQQGTPHTRARNRAMQHTPVLQPGANMQGDSTTSLFGSGPMRDDTTEVVAPPKQDTLQLAFRRFRTTFVLLVGFLVRVAFMYEFGQLYVQTIINPFVALEISILGFQKSSGMDLGSQVNGGIISALVLLGIRQNIINTYKQVLGVSTAVCKDFAFYFFAFVITHVLI